MKKEPEEKRMEVTPASAGSIDSGKVESVEKTRRKTRRTMHNEQQDKDALEMCDNDGNTPLMAAIGSGSIDCVRLILNVVKCEEHLQSSKLSHDDENFDSSLARQFFSFQNNDGLSPLQCSALLSNPIILLYLLQSVSMKFGRLLLLTETRDGNNVMHCA